MERALLHWTGPYRLDNPLAGEGWRVYVLSRRWDDQPERVLYIGLASGRSASEQLQQHAWARDLADDLQVRVAAMDAGEDLAQDVQALLIYRHQPRYNTEGKSAYRGRALEIMCEGDCGPIARRISSVEMTDIWKRIG